MRAAPKGLGASRLQGKGIGGTKGGVAQGMWARLGEGVLGEPCDGCHRNGCAGKDSAGMPMAE